MACRENKTEAERGGGGAIDSLTSSRKSVHDRRKKVRGTEDIGEWYIYRK